MPLICTRAVELGMLGKTLIKIVKETEVPQALWTWTRQCVWETGIAAASGRVGLDVFARNDLAVDANCWSLLYKESGLIGIQRVSGVSKEQLLLIG